LQLRELYLIGEDHGGILLGVEVLNMLLEAALVAAELLAPLHEAPVVNSALLVLVHHLVLLQVRPTSELFTTNLALVRFLS
jgi:hypothetical protein